MITGIFLILISGFIFNKLFAKLRIPGIIGMIVAGILIGRNGLNLVDPVVCTISADVRLIALMILLLRAGLGISRPLLNKVGVTAVKAGIVPAVAEGSAVAVLAHALLHFSWPICFVLGFIVAAVSPALIIPRMIDLREEGWGMKRGVPVLVLAAASLDNIVAVTLFTAFFNIAAGKTGMPLWAQLSLVPLEIAGGILIGVGIGLVLSRFLRSSHLRATETDELLLAIAGALSCFLISQRLHVAGLISIMTVGFIILEKDEEIAHRIASMLKKVWVPAEIFLFVLIGMEVNLKAMAGAGLLGLLIIAGGLAARTAAVYLATHGAGLRVRERNFIAISNVPKATVQAAVGGMPLAAGMAGGEVILAVSVLAVIITSFAGTFFMERSFRRLLKVYKE